MSRRPAVLVPVLGQPSETFIRRHVEDLADDTVVACLTRSDRPEGWGVAGAFDLGAGLSVADRVRLRLGRRHSAMDSGRMRARLVRHLLAEEVGVVLAEYLDVWADLVPDLVGAGVEVWGHAFGYDISSAPRDDLTRRRYRGWAVATGIITVGPHTIERIGSWTGIDLGRIHVVPFGVDLPSALDGASPTSDERADDDVAFLAVGRLVGKKDPISLVRAFSAVAEVAPGARLTVIGDGPLRSALVAEVARLGLTDRVSLRGVQPNTEVAAAMRVADVFVQHSRVDPETGDEEGLPVAILEAMSWGLPVVSTRHAGIPDAVVEGTTGRLVDEGDVDGMATAMAELAADSELRTRLGRAGRERVAQRFTWQAERTALRSLLGLDP